MQYSKFSEVTNLQLHITPWGFQGFQYRVFFKDRIFYSGSILIGVKYFRSKILCLKIQLYSCRTVAVSTVDADGAAACGNDARQAVLLEPMDMGSGLVGVQPYLELSRPKCSMACAEPGGDLQTRSQVA
jgi:hypothetical protein